MKVIQWSVHIYDALIQSFVLSVCFLGCTGTGQENVDKQLFCGVSLILIIFLICMVCCGRIECCSLRELAHYFAQVEA